MKIILAHGVLGFGRINLSDRFSYFKGVWQKLHDLGHDVQAPSVSAIGTIEARAETLANNILSFVGPHERALVIAHSMGGLDTRYAISKYEGIASRISTLVTIGTPHLGSPVADFISKVPALFDKTAVPDLTTFSAADFDQKHDLKGVTLRCIAGVGRDNRLHPTSFALAPTHALIKGKNDGMVAHESATRGLPPWKEWPTDHADEIGWNLDMPAAGPSEEHLARYVEIVRELSDHN